MVEKIMMTKQEEYLDKLILAYECKDDRIYVSTIMFILDECEYRLNIFYDDIKRIGFGCAGLAKLYLEETNQDYSKLDGWYCKLFEGYIDDVDYSGKKEDYLKLLSKYMYSKASTNIVVETFLNLVAHNCADLNDVDKFLEPIIEKLPEQLPIRMIDKGLVSGTITLKLRQQEELKMN